MTEEKMGKAMLCKEELDQVAGGFHITPAEIYYYHKRKSHKAGMRNPTAQDKVVENLKSGFANNEPEYINQNE